MNLQAIIFDLDGVITDTAEYHFIAWQALAKNIGFNLSREDNQQLKGLSRMASLKKIFELGEMTLRPEKEMLTLTDEKNEHYNSFLSQMTKEDTLPGVDDFLNECKQSDIKIAVGSASRNTKTILKQLQLETFFDAVVDGNMVTHSKPDPEVFLNAAGLMHAEPDQTVVFEDSISGIQAANEGGFFSIGVGDPTVLHRSDAVISGFRDFTLNDLHELIKTN